MYIIKATRQFKTDFKKLSSSDQKLVQDAVNILKNEKQLPSKYRDHSLKGNLKGLRDCHVKPDLILIYSKDDVLNLIKLIRVGNHSTLQLSSLQKQPIKLSNIEKIDNLIEDIYDLRKQGMTRNGEYDIFNLIFKEFRNLGYLDNLKELRKKEVSKELSLEHLEESIQDLYSSISPEQFKTLGIMVDEYIDNEFSLGDTPIRTALSVLTSMSYSGEEELKDFVNCFEDEVSKKYNTLNFVSFCAFIKKKYGLLADIGIFKTVTGFYLVDIKFVEDIIYKEVSNSKSIEEVFNEYGVNVYENTLTLGKLANRLFEYNFQTNTFNNKSLLAQEKEKFGIKH